MPPVNSAGWLSFAIIIGAALLAPNAAGVAEEIGTALVKVGAAPFHFDTAMRISPVAHP